MNVEIFLMGACVGFAIFTVGKEKSLPTLWPTAFFVLGLLIIAAVLIYADRLLTLAGA